MFGQKSTRQIDLHLPTGWNRCTTEELEAIAAAIISEQQRVDRYHPFDWSRVKLGIVLSINEITVMEDGRGKMDDVRGKKEEGRDISHQTSDISHQTSDIESTWLVKRPEDKEPWPITTGQLVALTERLAWIDDEKASKVIFQFPYPTLTIDHLPLTIDRSSLNIDHLPLTIQGPPPLLDGYTWQEYRWLTDWMQEYMRLSNARRDASTAQREFLAVLFKPAGEKMFNVQCSMFNDFSPVKWQVILFWWSSLMSILAKKFPKVFKQQLVGKGKRRQQQQDTPWDFYNRVTATIQKYIGGLSSSDVDNQPYGVTLQQLEMMADEAAEMEKLKKK